LLGSKLVIAGGAVPITAFAPPKAFPTPTPDAVEFEGFIRFIIVVGPEPAACKGEAIGIPEAAAAAVAAPAAVATAELETAVAVLDEKCDVSCAVVKWVGGGGIMGKLGSWKGSCGNLGNEIPSSRLLMLGCEVGASFALAMLGMGEGASVSEAGRRSGDLSHPAATSSFIGKKDASSDTTGLEVKLREMLAVSAIVVDSTTSSWRYLHL